MFWTCLTSGFCSCLLMSNNLAERLLQKAISCSGPQVLLFFSIFWSFNSSFIWSVQWIMTTKNMKNKWEEEIGNRGWERLRWEERLRKQKNDVKTTEYDSGNVGIKAWIWQENTDNTVLCEVLGYESPRACLVLYLEHVEGTCRRVTKNKLKFKGSRLGKMVSI